MGIMGISDCDMVSSGQGRLEVHGRATPLEQLFIIHRASSIVLFTHHFKQEKANERDLDDLNGAAIGMMDNLLGEILSSNLHIKQIIHEERVLLFEHGKHCCFILFTNSNVNEARFCLERFATDFETQFAAKLAGDFSIGMNEYAMATSLVERNVMA
jgi:hypothetical protein